MDKSILHQRIDEGIDIVASDGTPQERITRVKTVMKEVVDIYSDEFVVDVIKWVLSQDETTFVLEKPGTWLKAYKSEHELPF